MIIKIIASNNMGSLLVSQKTMILVIVSHHSQNALVLNILSM